MMTAPAEEERPPDLFRAGDFGSTIAQNLLRSLALQSPQVGEATLDKVLENSLIRCGFELASDDVIPLDLENWLQGADRRFEYQHVRLVDRAFRRLSLPMSWPIAKLLMSRAYAAGDYDGARMAATQALEKQAGKEASDELTLRCSDILGRVSSAEGDFQTAARQWAAGAEAARSGGLDYEEWDQRVGLIWCLQVLERLIDALDEIELAETIACRLGDCDAIAKTLIDRGNTMLRLARYPEADWAFKGALAAARVSGNRARQSDALGNLGAVADARDDLAGAEQFHRQSLEISLGLEDKQSAQFDLNNLAQALWKQGRSQEALEYEEQALAIAHQRKDRHSIERYGASARRMAKALGRPRPDASKPAPRPEMEQATSPVGAAVSKPEDSDIVENKVRELLNERRRDEAKAFLEDHLARNPKDARARALYAILLVVLGNRSKAMEEVESAVADAPHDVDVHFRLVDIYTGADRLSELRIRYEKGIADEPFQPALRAGLALVYNRLGRSDEASQQALEAVRLAPQEVLPLRVLAESQFAIAMSRLGSDWDAAWTAFQECTNTLNRLAAQPGSPQNKSQWLYYVAQCLERFAVGSFQSNPPLIGGMESSELFLLATAAGRYRQAQEHDPGRVTKEDQNRVGNIIQAFGQPEQMARAARYLRTDGDLSGAIVMLTLSLQKQPNQGAAYCELAWTMDAMGDREGARQEIQRALEFEIDNPEYREAKRLLDMPPEKRPKPAGGES
jgi:tetratricopeptide (TPR) repeat protein